MKDKEHPWDLAIRPAEAADREFLRHLNHSAYRAVVTGQFGGWDERDQDRRFEKWSRQAYQVVEHGGACIGALMTTDDRESVSLDEVLVEPAFQNRGIGTEIVQRVLTSAKSRNCTVKLRVLRTNRASTLYERLGFKLSGDTETHFLMEWRGE